MKKQNNQNDIQKSRDNRTLIKRMAYTIWILFIYHLLSYVSIPGVNIHEMSKLADNSSLTMLSMFSGGGFETFSLMSMGVSAYITAQIIVQLLQSDVVPTLTQWAKQGEVGRKKLNNLTRGFTLFVGFGQGIGITAGINQLTKSGFILNNSALSYILIATLLTAGSFVAMWMGDQITERGLGNGVSVIITAGIIAKIPDTLMKTFKHFSPSSTKNLMGAAGVALLVVLFSWLIVWVNDAEHRTPVQYERKSSLIGEQSFLPLKIVVPGVVPIIFASSLLSLPQIVMMLFRSHYKDTWYQVLGQFLTMNTITGIFLYAILIIAFTYAYSVVQLDPDKMADNFEKQEAYPFVEPGKPTANYFKDLLYTLALPGSLFLVLISVIPLVITNFISPNLQLGLSGSSLLIIIGVFTDIGNQIRGLKTKSDYPGFLNKNYEFD